MTLFRVLSITRSGEFRHRETVAVETPADFATSLRVGAGGLKVIFGKRLQRHKVLYSKPKAFRTKPAHQVFHETL